MAKNSYAPTALRAWRAVDPKRRTVAALAETLERTPQTIRNYCNGALPPERERAMLAIIVSDWTIANASTWRSDAENAREQRRATADGEKARAFCVEMGG